MKDKSGLLLSERQRSAFKEVLGLEKKQEETNEKVSTIPPQNPFKDIDPLTTKVSITKGKKFESTSLTDIIEPRLKSLNSAGAKADSHIFVKLESS